MQLLPLSNNEHTINEKFHVCTLKVSILPLTSKGELFCVLSTKILLRISRVMESRMLTPLHLFHEINARLNVPEQDDYVALASKGVMLGELSFGMVCSGRPVGSLKWKLEGS